MNTISATLAEHFGALEDPRVEHLTDHKLLDIIMIALCAIISGAETWKDMALFGQERLEWLRQFMPLENGIPVSYTHLYVELIEQSAYRCARIVEVLRNYAHNVGRDTGDGAVIAITSPAAVVQDALMMVCLLYTSRCV